MSYGKLADIAVWKSFRPVAGLPYMHYTYDSIFSPQPCTYIYLKSLWNHREATGSCYSHILSGF